MRKCRLRLVFVFVKKNCFSFSISILKSKDIRTVLATDMMLASSETKMRELEIEKRELKKMLKNMNDMFEAMKELRSDAQSLLDMHDRPTGLASARPDTGIDIMNWIYT